MNLFNKNDICTVNNEDNCNIQITKSEEILLNIIANKGYYKNLTNTEIINNKKMFYIQGLFKEFSNNCRNNCTKREWSIYLNNKCEKEYGIKIYDLCIILGNRLYNWLLNPEILPNIDEAKKYRRIGVDNEDKEIIKNSVKYYNIKKEHCINWIYQLIVYRNYKGGNAEKLICNILKKLINNNIGENNNFNIRLSNSNEDSKGIDLVIEINNRTIPFQVKRHSFSKYKSIEKHYSNSYNNNINIILYHDKNNSYDIINIDEIINIIKNS